MHRVVVRNRKKDGVLLSNRQPKVSIRSGSNATEWICGISRQNQQYEVLGKL